MKAKFVNKKPDNELNESLKIGNQIFKIIHLKNGAVYVSEDGILGDKRVFISWDILNKIRNSF